MNKVWCLGSQRSLAQRQPLMLSKKGWKRCDHAKGHCLQYGSVRAYRGGTSGLMTRMKMKILIVLDVNVDAGVDADADVDGAVVVVAVEVVVVGAVVGLVESVLCNSPSRI